MFKTSLEQFIKKFALSTNEKNFLISHEKELQEKAKKDKEYMKKYNNNLLIKKENKDDNVDESIQCDEENLDKELKEQKNIRDLIKLEKVNFYKKIKHEQKVDFQKIDNSIILRFSGNKSCLDDKFKQCRFFDNKHVIYPLLDYSFNLSKTKSFSFKFELLSYTVWIAVGFCDLLQIKKSGKIFYKSKNNEYPHGTFVLGSVRKFQEGYRVIKFHHGGNEFGAYEIHNDFPYFLPGRIINVYYEVETRKIIYSCGVCEVSINNCTTVNGVDDVLAPCVVFFYDQDKIKLLITLD